MLQIAMIALLASACAPSVRAGDGGAMLHVLVPAGGPVIVSQPLSEATVRRFSGEPSVWSADTPARQAPSQWRRTEGAGGVLSWVRPQTARAHTYAIRAGAAAGAGAAPMRVSVERADDGVTVDTGVLLVRHDLRAGGMPTEFRPHGAADVVPLRWQDRVYSPEHGEWTLAGDAAPQVAVAASGPLQAQVIVRARYSREGTPAPGNPEATYTFTYTAGSGIVDLEVSVTSADAYVWEQLHTVEVGGPTFAHVYLEENCRTIAPAGKDQFTYADSCLIATGPEATIGILRDPARMSSEQERLAVWDPAPAKSPEAAMVPPYIRGPWLWGWHGAYRHRVSLALLPADLSQDAAQALAHKVLRWPVLRVMTPGLKRMKQALAAPIGDPASGMAGWWAAAYARGLGQRGADDLTARADGGEVAEAELQGQQAVSAGRRLAAVEVAAGSEPDCWAARAGDLVAAGTRQSAAAIATSTPVRLASLCRRGGQDLVRAECLVPALRAMLKLPDGTQRLTSGEGLHCETLRPFVGSDAAGFSVTVAEDVTPQVRLRAEITCRVAEGSPDARFGLRVQVSGAGLEWVRFPDVACAPIGGRDALEQQVAVSPRALPGNFIRHPFGSHALPERSPFGSQWEPATMMYPQMSMPVQMTCLFRLTEGRTPGDVLYSACEDSAGSYKAFQYVAGRDPARGPCLQAGFVHVPEGPGTATRYTIPYSTVLAPLTGDWFDAVVHYRQWVTRQPWCARGPLRLRRDQPAWIRETPLWYFVVGVNDTQVQTMADCADLLGVPTAVHLYDWHHNNFDSRMPEYFPPRRGEAAFVEDLRLWRRHGARTVPYIQGVLWDMLAASWEAEGAAPYAGRSPDGEISRWVSNPGTPDEGHCAEMCMATDFWHDKLEQCVEKLAAYGADGVYLDSVGCGAWPCYAGNHGHPAGRGGTYWTDGVRRVMARLRRMPTTGDEALVFTTEGFTETCLDGFDAFLPHMHHPRVDEGCVYDALYHDYTVFHGAFVGDFLPYKPDGTLPQAAARCFALGRPLGWFYYGLHNDYYLTPEAAEDMAFVGELARARMALGRFLETGTMLRPPVVIARPATNGEGVLASMWTDGDRVLVVAVNGGLRPLSFRMRLDAAARGVTLRRAWPEGQGDVQTDTEGLTQPLRLQARAAGAWVVAGERHTNRRRGGYRSSNISLTVETASSTITCPPLGATLQLAGTAP